MRKPLLVREIVGDSMLPNFARGQRIVASGWFKKIHPGQVVIINHDGREKVKRVERINDEKREVFVIGDNLSASTDGRHFGWLDYDNVVAKVIFPNKNLHKP